jgi:uncharacterized protein YprB with RNaseH-like and TPR domain
VISASLRQRIGDLLRREPRREVSFPRPESRVVPTSIEDVLPGGIVIGREGACFVHERLYTELNEHPVQLLKKFDLIAHPELAEEGPHWMPVDSNGVPVRPDGLPVDAITPARRRAPRTLPEAVAELDPPERGLFRKFGYRRILFLDIETCGLQPAPVFLVGLCHIADRNLVLRQLFARDYSEERAVIAEVERIIGEHDFLVTYNGKTFDIPFLRSRAVHHRIGFTAAIPHLDLLWMVRRRWKDVLPNCKLKTLEWRVLRRLRAGDIDGAEIPYAYHEYVKHGQPHRLIPVFHHNLLDLVAMAELLPKLFDPEEER